MSLNYLLTLTLFIKTQKYSLFFHTFLVFLNFPFILKIRKHFNPELNIVKPCEQIIVKAYGAIHISCNTPWGGGVVWHFIANHMVLGGGGELHPSYGKNIDYT